MNKLENIYDHDNYENENEDESEVDETREFVELDYDHFQINNNLAIEDKGTNLQIAEYKQSEKVSPFNNESSNNLNESNLNDEKNYFRNFESRELNLSRNLVFQRSDTIFHENSITENGTNSIINNQAKLKPASPLNLENLQEIKTPFINFNINKSLINDEISEYNLELNNDNDFINMSRFDESSKAGFTINYDERKSYKKKPILNSNADVKDKINFQGKIKKMNQFSKSNNQREIIENSLGDESPPEKELNENKTLVNRTGIKFNDKLLITSNKGVKIQVKTNNNDSVFNKINDDYYMLRKYNDVKNTKTFIKFFRTFHNSSSVINKKKKIVIPIELNHVKISKKENIKLTNVSISKKVNEEKNTYVTDKSSQQSFTKSVSSELSEIKQKYENVALEYEMQQIRLREITLQNNKISDELNEKNNCYEKLVSKYSNESLKYSNELDNVKLELTIQKSELLRKNEKISELININSNLEKELNELKSRSSNEINCLRESKQNLDLLKFNYYEIKNQYELLNMKNQSLTDENFNIKRDLLLYEKEIKNKNETIEKLRKELIETNKMNFLSDIGQGNLSLNLNLNNILKGSNNCENHEMNQPEKNNNNQNKRSSKNEMYEKNLDDFHKISHSDKVSNVDDEKKLKNIESKMVSLNKERDLYQAELNKLPIYPKKKDLIMKRQELEEKIESCGKDLAKLKQEQKGIIILIKEN